MIINLHLGIKFYQCLAYCYWLFIALSKTTPIEYITLQSVLFTNVLFSWLFNSYPFNSFRIEFVSPIKRDTYMEDLRMKYSPINNVSKSTAFPQLKYVFKLKVLLKHALNYVLYLL